MDGQKLLSTAGYLVLNSSENRSRSAVYRPEGIQGILVNDEGSNILELADYNTISGYLNINNNSIASPFVYGININTDAAMVNISDNQVEDVGSGILINQSISSEMTEGATLSISGNNIEDIGGVSIYESVGIYANTNAALVDISDNEIEDPDLAILIERSNPGEAAGDTALRISGNIIEDVGEASIVVYTDAATADIFDNEISDIGNYGIYFAGMNGSSIDASIQNNNIDDTDTGICLYAEAGVEINAILNDNIFGELINTEIAEDETGTGIINYSGSQTP